MIERTISINTQIETLNKSRLGVSNGLVWGGAVYEEKYLSTSPRVLFLLKESNCQNPGEVWGLPWHLRNQVEGVIDGPQTAPVFYNIWKSVGCMMASLAYPMRDFKEISSHGSKHFNDICKEGLSKVSVLNIKKTPGTSESKPSVLREYISIPANYDLLIEEIDLLEPELVVCGGTYDFLKGASTNVSERIGTTGARYMIIPRCDSVFLDFPHPSIRGIRRNVLYTYLQCVYFFDIKSGKFE